MATDPIDYEDQAVLQEVLDSQIRLLILDLDRIWELCPSRADRNYEAVQIMKPRLLLLIPKRHGNFWIHADLPDSGHCRFELRASRRPEDIEIAEPVFADHSLNFMKTHHEWVTPPAGLENWPRGPKTDSISSCSSTESSPTAIG